jgi:hypothetical protein
MSSFDTQGLHKKVVHSGEQREFTLFTNTRPDFSHPDYPHFRVNTNDGSSHFSDILFKQNTGTEGSNVQRVVSMQSSDGLSWSKTGGDKFVDTSSGKMTNRTGSTQLGGDISPRSYNNTTPRLPSPPSEFERLTRGHQYLSQDSFKPTPIPGSDFVMLFDIRNSSANTHKK